MYPSQQQTSPEQSTKLVLDGGNKFNYLGSLCYYDVGILAS